MLVIQEKGQLKLNNVKNENIHGHKESLAAILKMVRRIKRGLFIVRSIELRKEFLGGWRVVIYLGEVESNKQDKEREK